MQTVKKLSSQRSDKGLWIYRSETNGFDSRKAILDNIPENKAGMFQGLRIVGQVLIPGVIGPIFGAMILSGAKEELINGTLTFIPNEYIFLGALVVALVLALGLGALFLLKGKKRNEGN